jgi:hypothetical protein
MSKFLSVETSVTIALQTIFRTQYVITFIIYFRAIF